MTPLILPGVPKLSNTPTQAGTQNWTGDQRSDLIQIWQDIKRVLDSMRRDKGVTGAISTGTVIHHNLGAIPKMVLLTAQESGPTDIHPSALTLTSFTLNFSGGGSHVFGWSAEL
jgi:hypothetical protein